MIRAPAARRSARGSGRRRRIGAVVLLGIAACAALILDGGMPAPRDLGNRGSGGGAERLGWFMVASLEQGVDLAADASSGEASATDVGLALTAAERYLAALVELSSLSGSEGTESGSLVAAAARRVISAVESGRSGEAHRLLADELVPAVERLETSGEVATNTIGHPLPWLVWAAVLFASGVVVARRRAHPVPDARGTPQAGPAVHSPGASSVDLADVVAEALKGLDPAGVRTVVECESVVVDTDGDRLARAVRVLVVAAAQRGGGHVGVFSRLHDGRAAVIVAHDGEPGMGIDGRHTSIAVRRARAALAALGARIEVSTSPDLTVCAVALPGSSMVAAA